MGAESKIIPFSPKDFGVCTTCSVRRYGVCGALKTPQLMKLGQSTRQKILKKGTILQFDEEETHEYVNIVSGVVKLTKLLSDGRQQIVGLQFPPEFVGRPYADHATLNAEAASDLEVCIFPKNAAEAMMEEAPEFERRIFKQTLDQLDAAREWMLALGRKTATEKLATLLVSFAGTKGIASAGDDGSKTVEIVLSRSEIADFLGLTIETVSREFTKLRNSGIIRINPGHEIVVDDLAALEAASEPS